MTRSQRVLIAAAVAVTMAGCQTNVRAPKDSLYRLTQRNVAYRDLTLPASIDNEPLGREYGSFPAGSPPFPVEAPVASSTASVGASRAVPAATPPVVARGPVQTAQAASSASAGRASPPATAEKAAAAPYGSKPTAYVPVAVASTSSTTTASAKPTSAAPAAPVAAPVATAPASVPPSARLTWQAPAGSSMHAVVNSWVALAGWTVKWEYDDDFAVDLPRDFSGNFTAAVTSFLGDYSKVEPAPHACLYPDQHPTALIRIIPSSRRCID